MTHIKQNDGRCIKIMQEIGCFVRSCGLIAEIKTGKSLTAEQVNGLWSFCRNSNLLTEQNSLKASAPVINQAMKVLGGKGKFTEVGIFSGGKANFYKSVDESHRRIDALIQKIRQNGINGTHFRVVDRYGNVIEDPHEPPIKPAGIIYSILYCYDED